jgi:sulfite reductase (NADPH) flavoprotein alpha-component
MLSETKLSLLQQLVQNASMEEIIWTKGYLAGFYEKNFATVATVVPTNGVSTPVTAKPTIIYGTETGNAKKIATQLLSNFKKNKIQAKSIDVFQYDFAKLESETLALFIVSTQGEGEFPLNAKAFYEKLSTTEEKYPNLRYAVLGIGDSSYPLYCHAGVLLDEALEKAGAKRILPLVKADVNFSDAVKNWESELQTVFSRNETSTSTPIARTTELLITPQKKNYTGVVSHKIVLNDIGSHKETYHIEINVNDEIAYLPGDSLGIIPKNDPETVSKILSVFNENPSAEVKINNATKNLEQWLTIRNIKGLGQNSLKQIAELLQIDLNTEKADLLDILPATIPADVKLQDIIALLLPIAPRLYSISSSPEAHPGQIHLTVNLNRFHSNGKAKTGLASQSFADFPLDNPIEFYIHKNPNFRLPAEETDTIMIGPGTGIAPFRSFIAHRDATGAEGKNWLFFGEQHFVQDFYYQTEIQDWLATGVISELDTAFSRDQKEKIYVQHRIRQKGRQFWEWLQNGANLYICGQKYPMSIDVENTIIDVIAEHGGLSKEAAWEFLENLEMDGKYQKDVY